MDETLASNARKIVLTARITRGFGFATIIAHAFVALKIVFVLILPFMCPNFVSKAQ